MQALWLLIPISFVLVALAVAVFVWSVNHRQFEDLERQAMEIFDDNHED